MNRQARIAALKIHLLLEEHSAEELAEALSLVGGRKDEDLTAFLARISAENLERGGNGSKTQKKGRSAASKGEAPKKSRSEGSKGETRALQELRESDPEKYRVLVEFESLVREGNILKTLDDFRAFGKVLSKTFQPGKSRQEALGRLMSVLAEMDLSSIRAALEKVPSSKTDSESSYRRLAHQIVSGSAPPTENQ